MKIPMKSILGQITLLGAAISFSSQAYALDSFKTDDYSRQCPELNQDFDFNFKYITPDSCYYFAEEVRCGFGSEKACTEIDLSDCDNGFRPTRVGPDIYCSKKKPHNPLYAPLDALYGESGVFSYLADYYSVGAQARGPLRIDQIKFTSQNNETVKLALTMLWERWEDYTRNRNDLDTRNKIGHRYLDTSMYRLKTRILEAERQTAEAVALSDTRDHDPESVEPDKIIRLYDAAFESLDEEVKYYMEHIFTDEKNELHELIENRRKDFYENGAGGDDTLILFSKAIEEASFSLYEQAIALIHNGFSEEERMSRRASYREWQNYVQEAFESLKALKLDLSVDPESDKELKERFRVANYWLNKKLETAMGWLINGSTEFDSCKWDGECYQIFKPACEKPNIKTNQCMDEDAVKVKATTKFQSNTISFNGKLTTLDNNSWQPKQEIVLEGKTYVYVKGSSSMSKNGEFIDLDYRHIYPACVRNSELKVDKHKSYWCYEILKERAEL